MKKFSGKLPFFVTGSLFAAALTAAVWLFGNDAGSLEAVKSVGAGIQSELTDAWWRSDSELGGCLALLIGILIGAALTTFACGKFRFRDSGKLAPTVFSCFFGGFLVMIGILVSKDTLWGHLAGCAALATGSWLFFGTAIFLSLFFCVLFFGAPTSGGNGAAGKPEKTKGGRK